MSIKIHIPSYFQSYTNRMEVVEVNGSTVGECLHHVAKQFPGFEKAMITNYFDIYVNGDYSYAPELTEPVKDGDELHIIASGGCCC